MTYTSRRRAWFRRLPGGRTWNRRWLLTTISLATIAVILGIVLHSIQSPGNAQFLLDRAKEQQSAGETEEAAQSLRLYLKSNPTDEPARRQLGLVLSDSSNRREAIEAREILLVALSRHPNDALVQNALLKLLLRLGDIREAVRLAGQMEANAKDAAGLSLIADAYSVDGQDRKALEVLRRALASEPKNLNLYAQYLPLVYRVNLSSQDLGEAVAEMLEATDEPAMAELVAFRAMLEARIPSAIEHLDRALESSPNNVEVLLTAASYWLGSDPKVAGRYLAKAYANAPQDDRILLAYGRWLNWAGQRNRALELFRAGYSQSGATQGEFAWRAAEILVETGRFDDASQYLATMRTTPGYGANADLLEGWAAILRGDLEEAKRALGVAESILADRNGPDGFVVDRDELAFKLDLAQAELAYREGNLPEAIRLAESAVRRAPTDVSALAALGQLTYDIGDFSKSVRSWSRALDGPFPPASASIGLARSLLAQIREQPASRRNIQRVQQLLERARRSIPNDPGIPLVEADALWTVGKLDAAIARLTAAQQAHPRDSRIAMTRIHALIADGQFGPAREALAKYESMFGSDLRSVLTSVNIDVDQSNWGQAIALLETSRKRLDSSAMVTLLRIEGQVLWLSGKTKEAGKRFEQAYKLDSEDELAWLYRWIWLLAQERADDAVAMVESARRNPNISPALWRWAEAMLLVRQPPSDPSEAAAAVSKIAEELREEAPFRWQTYHVLGLSAELRGATEDAIREYLRAVPNGPAPPDLVARVVALLMRANRKADAEGVLRMVRQQRLPFPADKAVQVDWTTAREPLPPGEVPSPKSNTAPLPN